VQPGPDACHERLTLDGSKALEHSWIGIGGADQLERGVFPESLADDLNGGASEACMATDIVGIRRIRNERGPSCSDDGLPVALTRRRGLSGFGRWTCRETNGMREWWLLEPQQGSARLARVLPGWERCCLLAVTATCPTTAGFSALRTWHATGSACVGLCWR
jgi:hypothetical protein